MGPASRHIPAYPLAVMALLSSAPFLTGIDSCQSDDADGDGWSTSQGDCDDQDATTFPGAPERCDGLDNDCDGQVDGAACTALSGYFRDRDGDGFGSSSDQAAIPTAGYVAARGDCDDTSPAIHPGAGDPASDGIDQDCGGTAGADPHVGLSASSQSSIQAALNAASSGQTVWIGPGTYLEHDLSFNGKAVTLASTRLAPSTVIDAQSNGSVMTLSSGEGRGTVIDGFTVTGGSQYLGGGLMLRGSSPTITHCLVLANKAFYSGGGLFAADGAPLVTFSTFSQNQVIDATQEGGGGIYLSNADATLIGCTLSGNSSTSAGGGLSVEDSSPSLHNCTFAGNHARFGGGLYGLTLKGALEACRFTGNSADSGAGMLLEDSSPALNHLIVMNNEAVGNGGGLYLRDSSPKLEQSVLAGNRASIGGGIYMYTTTSINAPQLINTIVAYSSGYNIFNDPAAPGPLSLTWCDVYAAPGLPSTNLANLDASNMTVEPGFLAYAQDGSPADVHLALGSSLINAGSATLTDVDGSRSDPGAYGGAGGDGWDLDADGFAAYFWPGTISEPPAGFSGMDYDADDLDPATH